MSKRYLPKSRTSNQLAAGYVLVDRHLTCFDLVLLAATRYSTVIPFNFQIGSHAVVTQ